MGTWSVTLYGSDAASDLRDDVRQLLRTPLDGQAILAALRERHPALDDRDDEEHADLWLALADQLHRHAVAEASVFATAFSLIDTGRDLAAKRALGMDERDLARRAKLLHELRARWSAPHPRPTARKIQTQRDAFIFEAGDCVVYPAKDTGKTINPYFAKPEADPDWRQEGFGAMCVLARGHYLDTFAWYAVARLSLFSPGKPGLDACASAMVEAQTTLLEERMGEKPQLCLFAGRLTPLFGRKMRIETVGRLVPDERHIREDLAAFFEPRFVPGVCLADELSGFGLRTPSTIPLSRYARRPPRPD